MRQTRSVALGLLLSATSAAGPQTPQLTVVPPNYNQAVARRQQKEIQLYVKRQKELASQAATAPLQQQIAEPA